MHPFFQKLHQPKPNNQEKSEKSEKKRKNPIVNEDKEIVVKEDNKKKKVNILNKDFKNDCNKEIFTVKKDVNNKQKEAINPFDMMMKRAIVNPIIDVNSNNMNIFKDCDLKPLKRVNIIKNAENTPYPDSLWAHVSYSDDKNVINEYIGDGNENWYTTKLRHDNYYKYNYDSKEQLSGVQNINDIRKKNMKGKQVIGYESNLFDNAKVILISKQEIKSKLKFPLDTPVTLDGKPFSDYANAIIDHIFESIAIKDVPAKEIYENDFWTDRILDSLIIGSQNRESFYYLTNTLKLWKSSNNVKCFKNNITKYLKKNKSINCNNRDDDDDLIGSGATTNAFLKMFGSHKTDEDYFNEMKFGDTDSEDEDYVKEDDTKLKDLNVMRHIMLIGPSGSGLTSMVYKAASVSGYDVLELNSSNRRNGKFIINTLEEATQSNSVERNMVKSMTKHNKANFIPDFFTKKPNESLSSSEIQSDMNLKRKQEYNTIDCKKKKIIKKPPSLFESLGVIVHKKPNKDSNIPDKPVSSSINSPVVAENDLSLEVSDNALNMKQFGIYNGPRGGCASTDCKDDEKKDEELKKKKKKDCTDKKEYSIITSELYSKNNNYKNINKTITTHDNNSDNKNKRTLILLDESDILAYNDKGYWGSIRELLLKSKRPIIMTSNKSSIVQMSSIERESLIIQKYLSRLDTDEMVYIARLILLRDRIWIEDCDLREFKEFCKSSCGDIRHLLHRLSILSLMSKNSIKEYKKKYNNYISKDKSKVEFIIWDSIFLSNDSYEKPSSIENSIKRIGDDYYTYSNALLKSKIDNSFSDDVIEIDLTQERILNDEVKEYDDLKYMTCYLNNVSSMDFMKSDILLIENDDIYSPYTGVISLKDENNNLSVNSFASENIDNNDIYSDSKQFKEDYRNKIEEESLISSIDDFNFLNDKCQYVDEIGCYSNNDGSSNTSSNGINGSYYGSLYLQKVKEAVHGPVSLSLTLYMENILPKVLTEFNEIKKDIDKAVFYLADKKLLYDKYDLLKLSNLLTISPITDILSLTSKREKTRMNNSKSFSNLHYQSKLMNRDISYDDIHKLSNILSYISVNMNEIYNRADLNTTFDHKNITYTDMLYLEDALPFNHTKNVRFNILTGSPLNALKSLKNGSSDIVVNAALSTLSNTKNVTDCVISLSSMMFGKAFKVDISPYIEQLCYLDRNPDISDWYKLNHEEFKERMINKSNALINRLEYNKKNCHSINEEIIDIDEDTTYNKSESCNDSGIGESQNVSSKEITPEKTIKKINYMDNNSSSILINRRTRSRRKYRRYYANELTEIAAINISNEWKEYYTNLNEIYSNI